MWRPLLGVAAAICLAANVTFAQPGGQKPNEPPRERAARERATQPADTQRATRSRETSLPRREPRQQAGERPWWLSEPSTRARPVARPAASRPQSRPAGPRKRAIFRLKSASAHMVVEAINDLLRSEVREANALAQRVALVPEPTLNSVLVSAAPEDLDAIGRLIEDLDQDQPMVMVQVLIAQMTLPTEKGRGRSTLDEAKKEQPITGLPEKSHFSVDRLKRGVELGVLGVSSEPKGTDEQLRELKKRGPVEVLNRPQIITLNNCVASLHVGSNEPVVRSSRSGPSGPLRQIDHVDVGLHLQLTPRVSPDGRVTMEVTLEISQLDATEDDDASASQPAYGSRIVITEAQTTVAVADGHTIVVGGLMKDSEAGQEELLILLTPHIVE